MPANLLDHALSKVRVHRSGAQALLVMDGNGHLACSWSELLTAMRWAVTKPARPRADICLELILERVSLWIVSSQCSRAPKGAAAHQWQLLCDLKSAGLGDGVSWRVQRPAEPAKAIANPESCATHPPRPEAMAPVFMSGPRPATTPSSAPIRARSYTTPGQYAAPCESDDAEPGHWNGPERREERRLRGDCRGRVIEESRNGGLHIELSGD